MITREGVHTSACLIPQKGVGFRIIGVFLPAAVPIARSRGLLARLAPLVLRARGLGQRATATRLRLEGGGGQGEGGRQGEWVRVVACATWRRFSSILPLRTARAVPLSLMESSLSAPSDTSDKPRAPG